MKIPSLDSLVTKSTATFRRFPLAILSVCTGSLFAMMLLHLPNQQQDAHFYYWNIVMSCYLLLLLSIAAGVFSERSMMGVTSKSLLQFGALAAAVIYFFLQPDQLMVISIIRFVLFVIGLHLLIAFAPFIRSGELNGFWQYNKIVLLRILTSALYTFVLHIGLMLALMAINELFKANLSGRIYGDLWIFLAGIFNTWFFLSGFPGEYASLESKTDYPKGLKIFTQYVLLPLITVYLLILYAYMFKIIFTIQWPVGWVSYLVLGFSIAGILSLLLIYPVRNHDDNKWILVYSRFFYFALFPLIVLLFLAIKRRLDDYGVTENRYFVLVLACWLIFIAVYFLFSKTKNIKFIPVSLCVVAFLTSFGPWGAFHVSLASQENHLEKLLEKNHMLTAGKINKADTTISVNDHREISSVVEYLVEVHGYHVLQPYFTMNLDSLVKPDSAAVNRNSNKQVSVILGLMNLEYMAPYVSEAYDSKYFDFRSENGNTMDISGFDYLLPDMTIGNYEDKDTVCLVYRSGSSSILIVFDSPKNRLYIRNHPDQELTFDISPMIDSLKNKKHINDHLISPGEMTLFAGNDKFSARVCFKSMTGEKNENKIKLRRLQADILIHQDKETMNEVGERKQ